MRAAFLIVFMLLLAAAPAYADGPVFYVEMDIYHDANEGQTHITKAEISRDYLRYPDFPSGTYEVSIVAANGTEYFKTYFDLLFESFLVTGDNSHYDVDNDYRKLVLALPFDENAKTLYLRGNGKTLIEYDLSPAFCKQDGVCSGYENGANCAADCSREPEHEQAQLPILQTGLLLGLIVLMAALLLRRKKRKSEI